MKAEDVVKGHTTPLGSPAFPRGPYRFTNREYLNITYRTDYDALRAVVPEPLEIDEPLMRFEVMKMPDTTGLGSYTECGQAIMVRMGQESGEYLHAMYLDNLPALAAGLTLPKRIHCLARRLDVVVEALVGRIGADREAEGARRPE